MHKLDEWTRENDPPIFLDDILDSIDQDMTEPPEEDDHAIGIPPSRPSEGQFRNSRGKNVELENSSDDSNNGGNENDHQQNCGWSQRSHDNTTGQRGTSRGALNSQDDQHNSGMSWAKGGENYYATQDTDHGYQPGIEEQRRFLASLSSSDDPYLGGSSERFRNVDEQMQSLGYGYGSSNDNYESSHGQFDGPNYGSSYGSTRYHGYDYSSSGNISGRYSHQLDGYVDHHRYNDHFSSGASGAGYHSHDYGSFDSASNGANDLVHRLCQRIRNNNVCTSIIEAGPQNNLKSSPNGLCTILRDKAVANVIATKAKISNVLRRTTQPYVVQCLQACSDSLEEKLFTLKLHHGGKLIEHPLKMYVGGRVDFVDFIDPDLMSLVELDNLVFLLCDDHVLEMGSIGVQFGEVSVYIVEPSFMGLLEDVIDRDIQVAYQCDNEGGGSGNKENECDNAEGEDSGFKGKECDNVEGGGSGFQEKECENAEGWDNGFKGKECDNVEGGGSGFQEKECENAEGWDNGFKGKECDNVEGDSETDTGDEFDLCDSDYDLSEEDDILYNRHVDPEIEILAKEMDSSNIRSKGKQNDTKFHQRLFNDVEMGMGVHLESDSDCESSADELQSLCSDDEENEGGTKYIRFNPKTDIGNPQFRIGMVFTSPDEFKQVVRSHAVHWQRDIVFPKNDKRRVSAKCKGTKCPWVALASKMKNSTTFQIRILNVKHKCGRTLSKNKFVISKLLSQKYKNDWRLNNGWRVGDFQEKDYTEELKKSNPNSTVVLKTDVGAKTGEEKFMRLYIYFDACKRGFMEACRPVIGVDGYHLKGIHKCVILTAVGLDPNNYVGIIDQQKWTFISGRQKGLLPDIEHRFCERHMYNNFKKHHHELALKDRLWNLARATTVNQFSFQMDSLKDFDEGAHKWISEVLPKYWSRSNFRTSPKCHILLNNICESFNAAILEARGKPLLSMVESIRILKRMEKLKDNTRSCISTYVGTAKFEVRDMYGQYSVDIQRKSCSCRRWDLMGILCSHGMSAIISYEKTVNCKRCGMSGHNKAKCTGSAPPLDDALQPNAPPTAAQFDLIPEASAQPSQPQEDHIATTQPAPNVKKRRCSVCLQEGHYRSKCPTPAGRIWRNYDRYSFNFQHNPVSVEPNAPTTAPRSGGSERVSEGAKRGTNANGESSSIRGASRSANIGGVSVETAFVKKGKHCVTLKSLQVAAKSRSVKEPFIDIGQSTQQSSSTAKTNSKKKKN
ncbi:hypothetical protein BUALT_Bualt19G0048800 [Buddleja alternifolia]|uniref:SWIM-type domain-containing protein n=1 Tax=Buddleja alternifolia TaxID=168488 RepID=A0AAV6W8U4_9LAMI|nr:hypothetical protein BUALT_Bualt19G0048800 [Buddleja alternifolia]